MATMLSCYNAKIAGNVWLQRTELPKFVGIPLDFVWNTKELSKNANNLPPWKVAAALKKYLLQKCWQHTCENQSWLYHKIKTKYVIDMNNEHAPCKNATLNWGPQTIWHKVFQILLHPTVLYTTVHITCCGNPYSYFFSFHHITHTHALIYRSIVCGNALLSRALKSNPMCVNTEALFSSKSYMPAPIKCTHLCLICTVL